MRIIGPPSAREADVFARLSSAPLLRDHRFLAEMFRPLWSAALTYTIDPVGVVAQAYKETGGGAFGGRVRPEFCNTCGLKNQVSLFPGVDNLDAPLAHARFANWEVGATAHVQHLRAYAGWPVVGMVVDPRYPLVAGQWCETFEDLGGKWAPAGDYGMQLVAVARRLQGAA